MYCFRLLDYLTYQTVQLVLILAFTHLLIIFTLLTDEKDLTVVLFSDIINSIVSIVAISISK